MESFLLEDFWTPEVFDNVFKPLFNGGLEFLEQPFETLCFIIGQQFCECGYGKAVTLLCWAARCYASYAKVGRQCVFSSRRACLLFLSLACLGIFNKWHQLSLLPLIPAVPTLTGTAS